MDDDPKKIITEVIPTKLSELISLISKDSKADIEFKKALTVLINNYNLEKGSDTPDFILAEYLFNCLQTFNITSSRRSQWYK